MSVLPPEASLGNMTQRRPTKNKNKKRTQTYNLSTLRFTQYTMNGVHQIYEFPDNSRELSNLDTGFKKNIKFCQQKNYIDHQYGSLNWESIMCLPENFTNN